MSALAARAEVGGALAEDDAADRGACAAAPAGLALPPVDAMVVLVAALVAVRAHEVADGRAPRPGPVLEHTPHRRREGVALGPRDSGGAARRTDPRQEQRLVRVDVADAGDHRLVEEDRLDGRAPSAGR